MKKIAHEHAVEINHDGYPEEDLCFTIRVSNKDFELGEKVKVIILQDK